MSTHSRIHFITLRRLRAWLTGGGVLAIAALVALAPQLAHAQAAPTAKPPAYSLPWQLRPMAVPKVLRLETSIAPHETATGDAVTTVEMITGIYPLSTELGVVVRAAIVNDSELTSTVANPLLGVTYVRKVGDGLKASAFGALALPLGMGGGNAPDAEALATTKAGAPTRMAMDNAMFSVNDLTPIVGASVAYIKDGLTLQAEATTLWLIRARGNEVQSDTFKLNTTAGLHGGYFLKPWVSAGADLRIQYWAKPPGAIDKGTAAIETVSAAAGVRFHTKVGGKTIRPGVSYSRALDNPLADAKWYVLGVDVPIFF